MSCANALASFRNALSVHIYTHTYWVDMKTFLFHSPVKYMHTSLNKVLARANRQHLYKNRNFFRCKGYTHTHTQHIHVLQLTTVAIITSVAILFRSVPIVEYARKKLYPVQMQQTIRQK